MVPIKKLEGMAARHAKLELQLQTTTGSEVATISREYNELNKIVSQFHEYQEIMKDIEATEELQCDPDLKPLADEELLNLGESRDKIAAAICQAMLPANHDKHRSAILEIRAGAGGQEAALFAADLYQMYENYAAQNCWTIENLDSSATPIGGYKEVSARIVGKEVFFRLRFEFGTHRVQRVPSTEASGRIHTSTATVAILPEPDEVEIKIADSDIRIDTMRAGGPGGQHANKTDSAVRITHLPTGITVVASEKSQHRNKASAMHVLRARLFEKERREIEEKRAKNRKVQVGTGDRSEKIRTYNFPEGRVTDHRIPLTLYNLSNFMAGDLTGMIDSLIHKDNEIQLAELDE